MGLCDGVLPEPEEDWETSEEIAVAVCPQLGRRRAGV